jgi:cell division transport system permease protein
VGYVFQQAVRAMRVNAMATLATITTMVVSLAILGAFSLLTLNTNKIISQLESELEVQAFLADGADPNPILRAVRARQEVLTANLVTKAVAFQRLQQDFTFLRGVEQLIENPLPDTIVIRLADPSQILVLSAFVRGLPGVAAVEDGQGAVERILLAGGAVRVAGYVLIAILVINSLFAIINTIRIAILARRQEILVMRMVGATRGFIRAPFVLEGAILGFISGSLTLLVLVPAYYFSAHAVAAGLPFLPVVTEIDQIAFVGGSLVLLGILIGTAGSSLATNQYLREAS